MMRLLVLCPYPEGRAPSQRLKFEQYYASWRSHGYEVDVRPFWSEPAWDILYAKGRRLAKARALLAGFFRRLRDYRDACRADLVYLHLEAAPLGPALLERRLKVRGVPLIYDIDDLVYLPRSSSGNRFMRWARNVEKIPELMRIADQVIVCTEYLRTFAVKHNANATNISSTIDTDSYQPRTHRGRTHGVVVGWSGSHSTSPYLKLLEKVLRTLQESDGIEVRVIGDEGFSMPGIRLKAQRWVRESEVSDLSEIDIGVYPLPDEEWVLGKSGLKALQYMALEIPTVAQSVGANLQIIENGRNGFLAKNEGEWLSALRELIRDPDLRLRVGKAARQTVEERYSVRANERRYLDVLEKAFTERRASGS